MPVRAPDERRVEHARELDVVDVATIAAEKARVFLAAYGGSEEFRAHEPPDHTNRPRGCPEIAQRGRGRELSLGHGEVMRPG